MKTGSWAEINLDKIGSNLDEIKKSLSSKETKICCVVKANAYGCGAVVVAKYLENKNIDFLSVARLEEALELRKNKISLSILCMGYIGVCEVKLAIEHNISITVYSLEYAKHVDKIAKEMNKSAKIHIKIDTGMSRLGFIHSEAIENIKEIVLLKNIHIEGIYTHFARADEKDKSTTIDQFKKFKRVIDILDKLNINIEIKHCANSAAILDFNDEVFNMVRLGISLYGYYPSEDVPSDKINLKPCLKLKSAVTNVKIVDENVGVSYGHKYITSKKTKIVTISIGYADGFNRIQNKPVVLINGYLLNIIGRICMDQCMAEAPIDADISIGDEVTIIDNSIKEVSLEANAYRNETINYEILCMINRRVKRFYEENDKEYNVNYLLD